MHKLAIMGAMQEEIDPLLEFFKDYKVVEYADNKYYETNYKGIDPENSFAGSASNTLGFDYFNNPNTRSYYLTFKFGF